MEKRGGGYAKPNIRGLHLFILILLVIFTLLFSPIIYSIHESYKNAKVVTATISNVSGGGGRKINVRYRYEMQGRKYEADRRETPMEQKIGDKKKISVNLDAPEEILNHEKINTSVWLYLLGILSLDFSRLFLCS